MGLSTTHELCDAAVAGQHIGVPHVFALFMPVRPVGVAESTVFGARPSLAMALVAAVAFAYIHFAFRRQC